MKDTRDEERPDGPACFVVAWETLEQSLTLLAAPAKASLVADTVSALRQLQLGVPPSKLLLDILAATAWLTDDSDSVGGLGGGAPMT